MNYFDQPLTPGSSRNNTVAAATIEPPSAMRVLIVDDEPSVRKLLTVMLEQTAIPYKSASSGEEALQFLSSGPFDAIICDLQMPGMSGMDLLVQVRRQYPHLAFLMATGVDDV